MLYNERVSVFRVWIFVIVMSLVVGYIWGSEILISPLLSLASSASSLAILMVSICLIFYLLEGKINGVNAPAISPVKLSFVYFCIFFLTPFVTDNLFIFSRKMPILIGATYYEWPYSMLCFTIGAISLGLSSRFLKRIFVNVRKKMSKSAPTKLIKISINKIGIFAVLTNFLGVSAQIYMFYKVGSIPMLNSEVDNLRIQAASISPFITHIAFFPTTALIMSVEYVLIDKGTHKLGSGMQIANAFVSVIILLLSSARFPLAVALLGSLFAISDHQRKHFSKVKVYSSLVFILFFVLGIGYLRFRLRGTVNDDISGFIQSIVSDLFGYGRNFALVPRIFPSKVSYFYGLSYLRVIVAFIPSVVTDVLGIPKMLIWNTGGTFVKAYYGYTFSGGGLGLSALGEGYMNFGVFGVVLSSFFYALLMRFIEHLYLITPPNTVKRLVIHLLFASSFFYLTSEFVLVFMPVVFMCIPLILLSFHSRVSL